MLLKEEKNAIMKEYATHEGDTGSPEVQIAVLTFRRRISSGIVPSLPGWACANKNCREGRWPLLRAACLPLVYWNPFGFVVNT